MSDNTHSDEKTIDNLIVCPYCGSKEIAEFRLDSDWGYGGNYSMANPESEYDEHHRSVFSRGDRLDVSCHHCMVCSSAFEPADVPR